MNMASRNFTMPAQAWQTTSDIALDAPLYMHCSFWPLILTTFWAVTGMTTAIQRTCMPASNRRPYIFRTIRRHRSGKPSVVLLWHMPNFKSKVVHPWHQPCVDCHIYL